MSFRTYPRIAAAIGLIFISFLLTLAGGLAAVQELVSPFSTRVYNPTGGLVKGPDGNFWGTTLSGGPTNDGTIYRVKPDGTWETMLVFTNSATTNRGRSPVGRLANDGQGYLWGATSSGGEYGWGTFYKYHVASGVLTTVFHCRNLLPTRLINPGTGLTPDGKGFMWGTTPGDYLFKIEIATGVLTPVTQFTGTSGAVKGSSPYAELESDGNDYLWGSTQLGGTPDRGTLFKVNVNTGAVTTMVEFTGTGAVKGSYPSGPLHWDGAGYFWGTTVNGGTPGLGTVFKVAAASGQLTTLAEFTGDTGALRGANPSAGLVADDQGMLWGTTYRGGVLFGVGTVFKLNPVTGVTTMVIGFPEVDGSIIGRSPTGDLVNMGDGYLMGVTSSGGGNPEFSGGGTIYKINSGTGAFTNLVQFTDAGTADVGRTPYAGVVAGSDGSLWGSTLEGGRMSYGTLYKLNPATGVRTTLVEFTGRTGSALGNRPLADLVPDGNGNFWGTTQSGGIDQRGTLFKIRQETGALTTVFQFGQAGWTFGNTPGGLMIDPQGTLWGVLTASGSGDGPGGIYRVNPASGEVAGVLNFSGNGTENKGSRPYAAMIDDGAGFLWGTTFSGGAAGFGTAFKMEKSTGKLTTVVSFTGASGSSPGAYPTGRLADDGAGFLWGTTCGTDSINATSRGTVFKLNKATGTFTHVFVFTGTNTSLFPGSTPFGGLTPDGSGALWGMTSAFGNDGVGTVFRLNPATGTIQTMVMLDDAIGGTPRYGSLFRHPADGHFYATASANGPKGGGSVFRVRLGPVPLTTAPTALLATGATLNGTVSPNGAPTTVAFEYGTAPDLAGATTIQVATNATGTAPIPYSRLLTGLTPKTTYYYRISGTNAENPLTQKGQILSFRTPSNDAALADLALSPGHLTPAFQADQRSYLVTLDAAAATATLTATPRDAGATIRVNGSAVTAGAPVALQVATGNTLVPVVVTAEDGVATASYTISITRLPAVFRFASGMEVPLSAAGIAPDGFSAPLELAYAPVPGTALTLVRNTGADFIDGHFTNLEQGQEVILTFGGRPYRFVANYYGGSGNDLVLHWAATSVAAWGTNTYAQLLLGNNTDTPVPTLAKQPGALTGKTITAVANGNYHVLALCSDGTLAAWGDGFLGKLGQGAPVPSDFPVAVNGNGVLAGKRVVAIAAGRHHSVALCSDGTLAAWGENGIYGQVGDGATGLPGYTAVPVAVDRSGVLAGRKVVAIAAAESYTFVLCADGTIAWWGGQGPSGNQRVPVEFPKTGALAGKTVTSLSVSGQIFFHCTDGSVIGYGSNANGQVGNNTTSTAVTTPVRINSFGALDNRTILATSAGSLHSLALCSDGRIAAWGNNFDGQLGDGSVSTSAPYGKPAAVLVNNAGVLAGKQVIAVRGSERHSVAVCADGTAAAWGFNDKGQLGNGSKTASPLPVAVSMSGIPVGSAFGSIATGPRGSYNIGIIGLSLPEAVTRAASGVGSLGAQLRGLVRPNGQDSTAVFEWGQSTAYGQTVAVDGGVIAGTLAEKNVFATLTGLTPDTTYHFRLRVENASGTAYGQDMSFRTPNNNAHAASISTPAGLDPEFNREITSYRLMVPFETAVLPVTVIPEDLRADVTIHTTRIGIGGGTVNVNLPVGTTNVRIDLLAENGSDTMLYMIEVVRLPQTFVFQNPATIGILATRFVLPALPVNFELRFAPEPGTRLKVLIANGLDFTTGRFSNLAQGQLVTLAYQGKSYRFRANYYGGSGNALILEWADTAVYGWGANGAGQVGPAEGNGQPQAQPVMIAGANPASLTTFATAAGYLHSLALASDGTLRAWGSNTFGQLGDGSKTARETPAPVTAGGALAGKTVVAIAAGAFHNLALCSDGRVVAWGYNNHGQLGIGSNTLATEPVAVDATGVLANRQVVAISAGAYHSLALCSDGAVVAWGFNGTGALGDGTTTNRTVPVLVQRADGQAVAAGVISAGQYHSLMAASGNGQVYAWGYNNHGQLGDGTTQQQTKAILIASGAMTGQSAQFLAPGLNHSVVLMGTGSMAAWGEGSSGQLGNGGTASSLLPVNVAKPGVLSGVTIESLASGANHILAQTNIGTLVAWGAGSDGQLGNAGILQANAPQNVPLMTLEVGARFGAPAKGCCATHALAIVARPAGAGTAAPLVDAPAAANGAGAGFLAAWRTLHFGSPDNAGDAGDNADPDHDGIVNLIEYAFAADPLKPSASVVPQPAMKDGHLVIEFTAPADDMGITYGASWTREPGSAAWQMLADEGTGTHHVFRLPIDGTAGFMRLLITSR